MARPADRSHEPYERIDFVSRELRIFEPGGTAGTHAESKAFGRRNEVNMLEVSCSGMRRPSLFA
jgi:hypothetical protein